MKRFKSKIALLVPSCDAYADVWPVLFQAIEKFWPTCVFQKYLVTNLLNPQFEHVNTIQVGKDVSWSDNLIFALQEIPEPYVLLNIDDLILCKTVDHFALMNVVSQFIDAKGNYLRLNPTPPGKWGSLVGEILPGELYRASTVFSMWRKEVLRSVLRQGESAWHFEIQGSPRTDAFDKWFASRRPLLPHVNLVIKGKVDPRALSVLQACGLNFHSNRAVLSLGELVLRWMKERRSNALGFLPRRLARLIRNLFQPL